MQSDTPQKLSDIALFNSLEGELRGKVVAMWAHAERLLRHAQGTQPTYTSHGPDHALMLLKMLDGALEPLELGLTAEEKYIIVVATLLHDIGMVGRAEGNEIYRQAVRDNHHLRTRKYIQNNFRELGIENKFKDAIAEVAAAHRRLVPFPVIPFRVF